MKYDSVGYRVFTVFNYIILTIAGVLCILPLIHMFAVSLSNAFAANSNAVGLLPVGLNLMAYRDAFRDTVFVKSFGVTVVRMTLGTSIGMLFTFLMAYPLSKDSNTFPYRNVYVWLIVITMLFSGGLVPMYILMNRLRLMDTIWALVLPTAVNSFFIILLLNFFRQLPKELEESAFMDGASYFVSMYKIYIPLSMPVIATLSLFNMVFHWNSWFDGIIYMNDVNKYPLQSYLQMLLERSKLGAFTVEEAKSASDFASKRSVYVAEMFMAMLPIILVYPYLQKYFTTGVILGSVKG